MLIVYGIKNCDKVKKLLRELKEFKIEFEFYDYKKLPPSEKIIKRWGEYLGELPVNKRGTTYRKVKDEYESSEFDQKINLIIENSSLIKRPIVELESEVIEIGHDTNSIERIKQKIKR